jgi:hypothetical protein
VGRKNDKAKDRAKSSRKGSCAKHPRVRSRETAKEKLRNAGRQYQPDRNRRPRESAAYSNVIERMQDEIRQAYDDKPKPPPEKPKVHFPLADDWWSLPEDERKARQRNYNLLFHKLSRESPELDRDECRRIATERTRAQFDKETSR